MSKTSVMEQGLCYRRNCFNTMIRCGKGYCPTCCRAFHDHVGVSGATQGASPGGGRPSVISTAITPTTYTYEPGGVKLILEQKIKGR